MVLFHIKRIFIHFFNNVMNIGPANRILRLKIKDLWILFFPGKPGFTRVK